MTSYFGGSGYDYEVANYRRDPQQVRAGHMLLTGLRGNPPGFWSDDRLQQVQHYKHLTYIFIRAIMDISQGATFTLLKRKRRNRHRTTFGPKHVAKAMTSPHAQAQDEEYTPCRDLEFKPVKLLEQPNETECFSDLDSYVTLQNRLTGVAPLWHVPNGKGRPVELWALPTALTVPLWQNTPQYPKGAWRVQPFYATGGVGYLPSPYMGMGAVIPGEEIARFMDPHPYYKWDGYAPLSAGAVQLDILESIDEARHSQMANAPLINGILMVPGADEADLDRLDAKFNQKYSGARNAGRFAAIRVASNADGKLGFMAFDKSARDLDFVGGYTQMVEFVGALFGVPKGVACLEDSGSYSKLYADVRQFLHRQSAFVKRKGEFYTRALAWPWCSFPGEYKVQMDLPTPDDPDLLEKQLANDKGIRSVNERRALRNLPPAEKYGELPEDLFLKMLEKDLAPEPEPVPGMAGAAGGGGAPAGDPLDALLAGGGADGGTDGGSASGGQQQIPQPANPGSRGAGVPMRKALADGQHRSEGEKWEGEGGKWFTLSRGHVVPTKAPGGDAPGGERPAGQPDAASDSPHGKERAAARATVAEIAVRLKQGGEASAKDLQVLHDGLDHLTNAELGKLAELIAGGPEVDAIVEQAIADLGTEPESEPEPVKHRGKREAPAESPGSSDIENELRAAIKTAPIDVEKANMYADDILSKLHSKLPDKDLRVLAKKVTGRSFRTAKDALAGLREKIVAVAEMASGEYV